MSKLEVNLMHGGTRPLKCCILAYTFYESDERVIRYAEALAEKGADVEAIVLRRNLQPAEEVLNGVRILRIQQREMNERGKFSYLSRLLKFFFRSMMEITRRHLKGPYDIIHVHSVPDFEVFAACVPKLKGAKVILDIHDIVPEFFAAKFKVSQNSLVVLALKVVEKLSASFADYVIIANDLWFEKLTTRSVTRDKCSTFINYPDLSVFNPSLRTRKTDGKFILLYPGTLNWHQGLDILVKAFAIVKEKVAGIELHIYGNGSSESELHKLIDDLQLKNKVYIRPPLSHREIARVMANADLSVVPKRNNLFGGDAFSTKIFEFMSLGIPVVVADTRIDKYYFNESLVKFFKAGDEKDLARVIIDAYENREIYSQRASRAFEYVQHYSWERKKGDYLTIVEKLVNGQR